MKPLRLSLQAFGSYAGTMAVDFARLARHGIFAISGPTGAGKSTIFDALVYALYDDLPGFRMDGNVRSQYAADDVETRVRLEFEVHGARWAVERTPTQLVRRRRGHGDPIERKSTVVLERLQDDGTPVAGSGLSRKSAVADRIESLVGLSKAQFEQVVLIPQGRFEEVLKADTKARAVLLRRLFPVDVYGRVTAALKAMADERHQAYVDAARSFDDLVERLRASLVAALEAAGAPVEAGLTEPGALDVDRLARYSAALKSARLGLERSVASERAAYERAAHRLEEGRSAAAAWDRWQVDVARAAGFADEEVADARESAALERARRVADLEGALRGWEEATVTIATLDPERAAVRDLVAAAGRRAGQVLEAGTLSDAGMAARAAARLRHEAEALRSDVPRFRALLEERRALDDRTADMAGRREAIGQRAERLERAREALEAMAAEEQALADAAQGLDAATAAVQALETERDLAVRRAEATGMLETAGLARAAAAATAATAETGLADVRAAWRSGLAGRLAEELVDGHPCPTCGALEHPSPAPRRVDAPDDDALTEAESASEVAQRALRDAEARYAAAQGALGALSDARPLAVVEGEHAARQQERARCQEAATRLVALRDDVARRRTSIERSSSALDEDRHRLEVDGARLAAEEAAHARARAAYEERHGGLVSPARRADGLGELADDLDRLAELLTTLGQARSAARQCRGVLSPLLEDVGLGDPGVLTGWRVDPTRRAARAEALAARARDRAEVRSRIAQYEAADGPVARPDLAALEETAECAQRSHLELVGRHAVMEENAGFFVAGPSLLETATKEVNAARRALEQARTMADRCAGAGGGASPTRLSLENWVLADYLRHVLAQANERLGSMTGGRFALQLSEGVTDGRKAFGLELSAFDAYTGQVRPATTLSGGETFMAALALALGLADVVSGGSNRQMGALFVDEGFGSLDAQSLDSVVEVLRSLEDGGRLVGVVSHVEAVQRALPSGITVRATPSGSAAEVHYPPE